MLFSLRQLWWQQFVGGAKLFEAVTGYSYLTGLIVFGLVVVIYTTVGGFRGVAITDAVCAMVMLAGMVILLVGIIRQGGGYENIMENIVATKPEMLEPLSGGNMPVSLYISQWMLVGIFTLGLPQSAVRCLSYKDTKSLHHAIILGTVVVGAMNIGMNFIGVLSAGVLTGNLAVYGNSVDNIIPLAIAGSLKPLVSGICIIGPIAASISTISSLLLSTTSSIVKDVYMHEKEKKGHAVSEKTTTVLSQICTLVIGLIIFWNFHQSAKCNLEDQYVCFWWTGKCIFLDFPAWYVLEKSEQSRSCQCDYRWNGMLLCDYALWIKNRKFASDFDWNQCITGLHVDRFHSWQKNRR